MVEDPRFMIDGVQCEISVVAATSEMVSDYRLLKLGEICMPLTNTFRPKAVDALVGTINADATLTRLTSKLYLANSTGTLKVCGNIGMLPITTIVALPAEVMDELPTPVTTPDAAEIDTAGFRLSELYGVTAMLLGSMIVAIAVTAMISRRRGRNR